MDNFEIKTLTVGQLQTNCYLIVDRNLKECLIIDPGDSADYITRIIADEKCKPVTIIATHGHFDHILAVTELKLAYNIPFLINEKDLFLVKKMQNNAKYFLGINVDPPPAVDKYILNDEKIKIGSHFIKAIETPGHTPGGLSFYSAKQNILFSGDTLFANGGVGRTDFSYCSKNDLNQSLKRIFILPAKTIIYPGHGDISTLEREKQFHENIF